METLLTIKIPLSVLLFSEFTEGLLLGIVSYNGIVSTGTCAWQEHTINDMISDAMSFLFKNISSGWLRENNPQRSLYDKLIVVMIF